MRIGILVVATALVIGCESADPSPGGDTAPAADTGGEGVADIDGTDVAPPTDIVEHATDVAPDAIADIGAPDILPDIPTEPDVPEPEDTVTLTDVADDTSKPGCEDACGDGTVCKEGECAPVICEPGASTCLESGFVSKCDPFGAAFYEYPCAAGFECFAGQCKPPQANVLILFDTSGSMMDLAGSGFEKPWPECESLDAPATKLGVSKKAFTDVLEANSGNPARFSLLHFPQTESLTSWPSCDTGYYDSKYLISGDNGDHQTSLLSDWFEKGLSEVVVVPFGAGVGDNAPEVLAWMDGTETIEAVPGSDCADCPGMCNDGECMVHTDQELRADGGTPLGRTLYYAGEYIRRFVLVEGKPCTEDTDCGNAHYACADGACHDALGACRETVVLLFTDGEDTENTGESDFFNPINQAKRLHMGLSCGADTECAPGSVCNIGTCWEKGTSVQSDVLFQPAIGVCEDKVEACNLNDPIPCNGKKCVVLSNDYADSQGVQNLEGWSHQPLRVRVHLIDASAGTSKDNLAVAFWGGGEYVKVDATSSTELYAAISMLTDPKPNVGCQ